MKTAAQPVIDSLNNDHSIDVGTVVHAEWQHNRFYNTVVDNTPSEDDEAYDIEYFPIDSITEPNRPTSGICKALVGQSSVESRYHSVVPEARYYVVSADDDYQYWQSPVSAYASGIFPLFNATNFPAPEGETYTYDNLTCVRPEVVYHTEEDENGNSTPIEVVANKITFTVENTYAYPTDYDVQVKTLAGAWTTVASNLAIPADGKVELWYDGSNWSTIQNLSSQTDVSGIRLVVRAMDKEAYFNLIELGAGLERDLSSDLVSWNDNFNMGEVDFITPLGDISSNDGQVTLFHENDVYRNNNPSGPYYNLLDKGVILRGWMKYGSDLVPEFTMRSDTWEETEDGTMVAMIDGSTFFMETKPGAVLYRNIPVQEVVWRICDSIGFNNYEVTTIDETASIDIFWTDGDKTAWEIFSELARASQTAIYFDSAGVLQVKTRDAAWKEGQAADYEFFRDSIPGRPSNIESLTESNDYEANTVTINWQPTGFSETRDNIVPFEVVWEPEGDVVMRATALARDLMIGDDVINLQTKEGKTWPWKGMLNVEGEWISFDAKRYVHYIDGVRQTSWVEDYEQQKKLDDKAGVFYRHLNKYTGHLRVEQRGLWGTEEKDHTLDLRNWTKTRRRNYSNNSSPCSGIQLNKAQSTVTLESPKNMDMNDYTFLHHGTGADSGYKYLGFRMKIDKSSHKHKVGGMFFSADGGLGTGYFLEVMATSKMDGKTRGNRNEVMFYSMKSDGSKKVFGGKTIKSKDKSKNHKGNSVTKEDIGARMAVPANKFIDFDIWIHSASGGDDVVQIFANGKKLMDARVSGSWVHDNVSRMGLFTRGHSSVTFDYVYAINSPGMEQIDSESYFDRIDGGYYSTQADDWTYDTRRARRKVKKRRKKRRKGKKWKWVWKKYQQKYKHRFFDDFGPVAHEIREFDVNFENSLPVLESKLYFSNQSQVVCTEYAGNVSGATFMLANISRLPAIVNGDDERTAMGNGTINHKLFVYGRPVIQKDAQTVIKEDEYSIRRRGIIEVEYSSPWIQNEDEAERFGEWLTTHWSESDSKLDVNVYGNSLLELGDTVRVKYKHTDALFWVVGLSNTYEQGLSTNLTLRKARSLV